MRSLALPILALAPLPATIAAPHLDLGDHSGLAKLTLDEVEPRRGLVVHVQVGPADAPERADEIAEEIDGLVGELEAWLDTNLFGPAGLESARDRDPIEVVVLLDSASWKEQTPDRPVPAGAFHDPTSDLVVTYDLAWPGSPRSKRVAGLRHALVGAMLDARGQLPPAWLAEGVRQSAMAALGDEAAGEDARRERLAVEVLEGGLIGGFLLPVAELMNAGGEAALLERARAATVEVREAEAWTARRLARSGDQGAALFHFMLTDAERESALLEHLGAMVSGRGGDSLASSTLSEDFWRHLLTTQRAADRSFDPRGIEGPSAFTTAVAGLGLDDLEAGKPDELDAQDRIAMGLWMASRGRLEAAGKVLAAGAGDADVDRHLAAVTALTDLRRDWLEHLAAADGEGGKLRFAHEGRTVTADVARVGRVGVFLADNPRGVERVVIDELELGELVERMEKAEPAFGEPLTRGWGQALVGGRYKRSLTSAQKRDRVLAEDLEAVAGRMERGRILAALGLVGDTATATDEARLAAAAGLLADDADHELVQAERWRLESACEAIFEARFAATELLDLLAVTAERDGDHVSVTYDFRKDEQRLDWPAVAEYSPDFVARLPGLDDPEPRAETGRKTGYALGGSQAMQHLLSFAGPMKLTYELSFERTKRKKDATQHQNDFLYGSICDDLGYNHLRTGQFGELDVVVVDAMANEHQTHPSPLSYTLGQSYRIELELTEQGEAVTRLDGDEVFRGSAHGLESGRVSFLVHSDRVIHLQEVRIEGRLAKDQTATRKLYVDTNMRAVGFER